LQSRQTSGPVERLKGFAKADRGVSGSIDLKVPQVKILVVAPKGMVVRTENIPYERDCKLSSIHGYCPNVAICEQNEAVLEASASASSKRLTRQVKVTRVHRAHPLRE